MIELTLPSLHPAQQCVLEGSKRFTVLSAGRRWGKSRLAAYRCLETALQGGLCWWVSPSFRMSEIGWQLLKSLALQVPGTSIAETHRRLTFPGGGVIEVRSADQPDSLRGAGLDLCILDEAAYISEAAWSASLRPALSDREGKALFCTSPAGRNWVYRLYVSEDADHIGFTFPTISNPFISESEVAHAKKTLPERIFRAEYLGEFVDDSGSVFRNVRACATARRLDEGEPGRSYVAGVDWGKVHDFTVISIVDEDSNEVVRTERMNQVDYQIQIDRLDTVFRRFNPRKIVCEANAMGLPLIEQIEAKGWFIEPFQTTSASKNRLIDRLTLMFENQEISIPNDDTMIHELEAYEIERLPSGNFRYNAPSGFHDDHVISLALAVHGITSGPTWLVSSW